MRSVRCVLNISLQNIRKWSEDYRIWTIAVLVIILCFDSVRIMNTIAAALGNSSSLWIYPFAYSQYHMKLLYSLPIMLMYGREAQSKTKTASPATIPKSGERNRKIHSCMLYLISI